MAVTATDVETVFEYAIKVEEVAPATRKVTIEIPGERIAQKLEENFKDIRSKAALPGFRVGHAPRQLVEKKFGKDIREDVKRQLISESYQQAVEKNKMEVLGEPVFEKPEEVKLPESGAMSFSFEVEIRPQFELPELKGITVKKPKVEVSEKHLEQAMNNLREQQGTLVPVEDRGATAKDHVVADITIKFEGKELGAQKDVQFVVQPGRIGGIFIQDLDKQLEGVKSGASKTITLKAPADHVKEELRDKEVQIEITLKDIKKLELAEINEQFLENLGFKDQAELREALKEQMEIRVKNDVQQAMRDQVNKFLMDSIKIELPAKMSLKQTQRVVQRRASDLLMRGMPMAQVEANIEKIKSGAEEAAAAELKSFFILDKIAANENIEVSDSELNGQVAMVAMQTGERPEKLKQTMSKDGTLMNMYLKMRENKALDKLLENAKIEEVAMPEEEAPKA